MVWKTDLDIFVLVFFVESKSAFELNCDREGEFFETIIGIRCSAPHILINLLNLSRNLLEKLISPMSPANKERFSEAELLISLQNGEDQGYSILCDRYSGMLLGIISRIVNDVSSAENLLQDCFIKIWKNIHSFDRSKGTFATWLINIARNTAIDFTRSKYYSQKLKNQNLDSFVSSTKDISNSSLSADVIGIQQIVNKLPAQYQEIIDCMYFKGYTQQEISDEYDIPLGTVKTRTRMAMAELRKYFDLD